MRPTLQTGIPILPALNLSDALAFYTERLGFREIIETDEYAGVERDSVQVHFWLCDNPLLPKNSSCRIRVAGIRALYAEYEAAGVVHPSGPLSEKPWGFLEFTAVDVFGNALVFAEEVGLASEQE